MGDCSFKSKEASKDLWSLSWTSHHINLSQELGFSPYLEQGISLLEEISSVEDNELSKENTSTAYQWLQDGNFTSLVDDPNSNSFDEQEHLFPNKLCTPRMDSNLDVDEQVKNSGKRPLVGKPFRSKANERKYKIANFGSEKIGVESDRVEDDSLAKKQDHNAKERMRRMKLHASYIALGSLLPTSKIYKKRWAAPVIIENVLDYIPQLESEIEKLTLKKKRILSAIDENKKLLLAAEKLRMDSKSAKDLTVSVNKVRQNELVLQICRKRDINESVNNVFSTLLQKIGDQSIRVVSASTLLVCDERECYNIHIKMNYSSSFANGSDNVTTLKEQFIYWLS